MKMEEQCKSCVNWDDVFTLDGKIVEGCRLKTCEPDCKAYEDVVEMVKQDIEKDELYEIEFHKVKRVAKYG